MQIVAYVLAFAWCFFASYYCVAFGIVFDASVANSWLIATAIGNLQVCSLCVCLVNMAYFLKGFGYPRAGCDLGSGGSCDLDGSGHATHLFQPNKVKQREEILPHRMLGYVAPIYNLTLLLNSIETRVMSLQ